MTMNYPGKGLQMKQPDTLQCQPIPEVVQLSFHPSYGHPCLPFPLPVYLIASGSTYVQASRPPNQTRSGALFITLILRSNFLDITDSLSLQFGAFRLGTFVGLPSLADSAREQRGDIGRLTQCSSYLVTPSASQSV